MRNQKQILLIIKYTVPVLQCMTCEDLQILNDIHHKLKGLGKSAIQSSGTSGSPSGQVTFHSPLPDKQGIRQGECQVNH